MRVFLIGVWLSFSVTAYAQNSSFIQVDPPVQEEDKNQIFVKSEKPRVVGIGMDEMVADKKINRLLRWVTESLRDAKKDEFVDCFSTQLQEEAKTLIAEAVVVGGATMCITRISILDWDENTINFALGFDWRVNESRQCDEYVAKVTAGLEKDSQWRINKIDVVSKTKMNKWPPVKSILR